MELNFNEGKFDLILGMIPIGLKGKELGETKFESTELSWELIFKLSKSIFQILKFLKNLKQNILIQLQTKISL